jgi:hypothetical protein
MTHRRRVAVALLSALPVEIGNLFLVGMMLDPGPFPTGVLHKLLGAEWLFFHFIGFRLIDLAHRTFGTEKVGLVVAFLLAYLQTALTFLIVLEAIGYLRLRSNRHHGSEPYVPELI